MKPGRSTLRWLVLALGVVGLVGVVVGALRETRTLEVKISEPLSHLSLVTDRGDVTVTATDGPARVSYRRPLLVSPTVSRVQDGSAVAIAVRCDWPLALGCQGSFDVAVPPGVALTIETGSGSVRVVGITGGVVVDGGSADVDLESVAGVVRVSTRTGGLRGRSLSPAALDVSLGQGRVDLALVDRPEVVSVDVGVGDVDLVVPPGSYRVVTVGDQVTIGVSDDLTSDSVVTVATGKGSVTVASGP